MPTITNDLTQITLLADLQQAKGVLIFAGAGMSADLGIPTYWTGNNTTYGGEEKTQWGLTTIEHASGMFWQTHKQAQQAYFASRKAFTDSLIAKAKSNPANHYTTLLRVLANLNLNYFVTTSNIDRAFPKFGFDENRLFEVHGTHAFSQCLNERSRHGVFPTNEDKDTFGIIQPTLCPKCGVDTRPNIMGFDDPDFNPNRLMEQNVKYREFCDDNVNENWIILEFGVGNTVTNIRNKSIRASIEYNIPLYHINPNVDKGSNLAWLFSANRGGKQAQEIWVTMTAGEFIGEMNEMKGII